MTTIRLDSGSTCHANTFFMELHCTSFKRVNEKKVITYPFPKSEPKWGQGPETFGVDLLQVTTKFTVNCRVDRFTNKTSGWLVEDLADAAMVMDRLIYMQEHGGVVVLTRGLTADGYGTDPVLGTGGTRTYNVIFNNIQEVEAVETEGVADSLDVVMSFTVAEDKS